MFTLAKHDHSELSRSHALVLFLVFLAVGSRGPRIMHPGRITAVFRAASDSFQHHSLFNAFLDDLRDLGSQLSAILLQEMATKADTRARIPT